MSRQRRTEQARFVESGPPKSGKTQRLVAFANTLVLKGLAGVVFYSPEMTEEALRGAPYRLDRKITVVTIASGSPSRERVEWED